MTLSDTTEGSFPGARKGEASVALLGPSGSGKTVLLCALWWQLASRGGVPGLRLEAADPATRRYVRRGVEILAEERNFPDHTMAPAALAFVLRAPGRSPLRLCTFDVRGEDVERAFADVGETTLVEHLRAQVAGCEAALLLVSPEELEARAGAASVRTVALLEGLAQALGGRRRPPHLALVLTKVDALEGGGGLTDGARVEALLRARGLGPALDALTDAAASLACFGVSAVGRVERVDGTPRPPVDLRPEGVERPLLWAAEHVAAGRRARRRRRTAAGLALALGLAGGVAGWDAVTFGAAAQAPAGEDPAALRAAAERAEAYARQRVALRREAALERAVALREAAAERAWQDLARAVAAAEARPRDATEDGPPLEQLDAFARANPGTPRGVQAATRADALRLAALAAPPGLQGPGPLFGLERGSDVGERTAPGAGSGPGTGPGPRAGERPEGAPGSSDDPGPGADAWPGAGGGSRAEAQAALLSDEARARLQAWREALVVARPALHGAEARVELERRVDFASARLVADALARLQATDAAAVARGDLRSAVAAHDAFLAAHPDKDAASGVRARREELVRRADDRAWHVCQGEVGRLVRADGDPDLDARAARVAAFLGREPGNRHRRAAERMHASLLDLADRDAFARAVAPRPLDEAGTREALAALDAYLARPTPGRTPEQVEVARRLRGDAAAFLAVLVACREVTTDPEPAWSALTAALDRPNTPYDVPLRVLRRRWSVVTFRLTVRSARVRTGYHEGHSLPDPRVEVRVAGEVVVQTDPVQDTREARWASASGLVTVALGEPIEVAIYDDNTFSDDIIDLVRLTQVGRLHGRVAVGGSHVVCEVSELAPAGPLSDDGRADVPGDRPAGGS